MLIGSSYPNNKHGLLTYTVRPLNTVGPLIIDLPCGNKRVSTGVLEAMDILLVVQTLNLKARSCFC